MVLSAYIFRSILLFLCLLVRKGLKCFRRQAIAMIALFNGISSSGSGRSSRWSMDGLRSVYLCCLVFAVGSPPLDLYEAIPDVYIPVAVHSFSNLYGAVALAPPSPPLLAWSSKCGLQKFLILHYLSLRTLFWARAHRLCPRSVFQLGYYILHCLDSNARSLTYLGPWSLVDGTLIPQSGIYACVARCILHWLACLHTRAF